MLFLAFMSTVAASASMALAQQTCEPSFPDGTNCLFIGHSFFIPPSRDFDDLADSNGFDLHEWDYYFSGGMSGAPESLWDDTDGSRTAIEAKLASGEVELFGMTVGYDTDAADYALWIDLALSYNGDTQFFIGQPCVDFGPSMDTAEFVASNALASQRLAAIVTDLRQRYPTIPIFFIDYAEVASVLRVAYDDGELPDVTEFVGADGLFKDDQRGHPGTMMIELSALAWMSILYDADLDTLAFTEYESDVEAFVAQVLSHNEQFRWLLPDTNRDGSIDSRDVIVFINRWTDGEPGADFNSDGSLDTQDVVVFLDAWASGC